MGGIGGNSKSRGVSNARPTTPGVSGLSTEFQADNPQIMPVYNSPSQIEAAKRKRLEVISRSGRSSTNMTGNPGTVAYQNSFLGGVQ